MTNLLNEFGKNAQKLARNPLGIIALFIVLVYGFAILLLGMSGDTLDTKQKWVMVWFIVGFPVLVLFVFYRLVTKHHTKLYSPGDYPDPNDFLRSISPDQQALRIKAKTESSKTKDKEQEHKKPESTKKISKSEYLLVEDLVFQKLKEEFKDSFKREVNLKNRADIIFDGAATKNNTLYLIEIQYTDKPKINYYIIDALKERARTAQLSITENKNYIRVKLLLVVVADLDKKDMYKLESYLHEITYDDLIEFRMFDFAQLKKRFKKKKIASKSFRFKK